MDRIAAVSLYRIKSRSKGINAAGKGYPRTDRHQASKTPLTISTNAAGSGTDSAAVPP